MKQSYNFYTMRAGRALFPKPFVMHHVRILRRMWYNRAGQAPNFVSFLTISVSFQKQNTMAKTNKKRPQNETDNGGPKPTKIQRNQTKYVPRVSLTGPIMDPSRELKLLHDIVEKELFPHCKFINHGKELDNISRKSIAGLIAKKMNIPMDEYFPIWWSKQKKIVKTKMNSCRTDANSAMRKKYLGMTTPPACFVSVVAYLPCCILLLVSPLNWSMIEEMRMEGQVIDLKKICKNRQDEDDQYTMFMSKFVPCVAGLKVWTLDSQKTTLVSKAVTPSDEALAILLMMNSIDRWEEMHLHELSIKSGEEENTNVEEGISDDNHPSIREEDPLAADNKVRKKRMKWKASTLYTMDCKKKQNKEFGGWNNEGKTMYNLLVNAIKEDRINNPDWEKQYLHKKVASYDSNEGTKGKCHGRKLAINDEEEVVEANNDLCFSESESEEEEEEGREDCPIREVNSDSDSSQD